MSNLNQPLSGVLDSLANALGDFRLRPPDVHGHLFDRGIGREELEAISKYVASNWPQVHTIEAGTRGPSIYFAIWINDYSEAAAERHAGLARWIRDTFPGAEDITFLYFQRPKEERFTIAKTIYPLPSSSASKQE